MNFQLVLVKWMNIETVIQNEVSQREKILMQIYGVLKNGTDELICKAAVEMQTYRTDLWT